MDACPEANTRPAIWISIVHINILSNQNICVIVRTCRCSRDVRQREATPVWRHHTNLVRDCEYRYRFAAAARALVPANLPAHALGMRKLIVTGDIGGTNARLAIFDATDSDDVCAQPCVHRTSYRNEQFSRFHDVLDTFVQEARAHLNDASFYIAAMCLAVAGPVVADRVSFTNRQQWILDANELRDAFHIDRVRFLNDFVSNGYGLLTLREPDECYVLQRGEPSDGEPKACIGAGTGLGECYLTACAQPDVSGQGSTVWHYEAHATEGGHVDFAPITELELELLQYLRNKFGDSGHRVSVERVVSGRGLVNIYEFLREKYPEKVQPSIDKSILESNDGAATIARYVYECGLCAQAMRMMMDIYGTECGNAALKYLPFSGLYIAGGIAPKNLEWLQEGKSDFLKRFREKGRVSTILRRIPVKVVLAEDLGLRGAHVVAARMASDTFPPTSATAGALRHPRRWYETRAILMEHTERIVYFTGLLGVLASCAYTGASVCWWYFRRTRPA
jgi:glucokinase